MIATLPPTATRQHVEIADDAGMVGAGKFHPTGGDAGGDHDFVEAGQRFCIRTGAEAELHAGVLDAVAEVAQWLVEFLLAGNALG